ncbi:hypothetical protein NQ317_001899 [Molorchus minor]|uniref:Uncharacterized protein n=1 Tax=Molorchus minor TaxID=1323400 RepID=A0ABQ9IXA9_9CUCU|nr:hypothetical protein NQ317_001899 [Molorchus minor]
MPPVMGEKYVPKTADAWAACPCLEKYWCIEISKHSVAHLELGHLSKMRGDILNLTDGYILESSGVQPNLESTKDVQTRRTHCIPSFAASAKEKNHIAGSEKEQIVHIRGRVINLNNCHMHIRVGRQHLLGWGWSRAAVTLVQLSHPRLSRIILADAPKTATINFDHGEGDTDKKDEV